MGWFNENAPDHEGYLVAVVELEGLWRELAYPYRTIAKLAEHLELAADPEFRRELAPAPANMNELRQRLSMVQVGCECGWRSKRLAAPPGTYFSPFTVEGVPEHFEAVARKMWREHVQSQPTRPVAVIV